MSLTTVHQACTVVRCATHERPGIVPLPWAAESLGVDQRRHHQTWVIYDPAVHSLVRVLGSRPAALHRTLLRAGCHMVLSRPDQTVYLVPRSCSARPG